MIRQQVQ